MDILSICEDLAAHVSEYDTAGASEQSIAESDIEHWQLMFKLTRAEAEQEITDWRADLSRNSLSQTAWETINESASAKNFTKESYEYSLTRDRRVKHAVSSADDKSMYLLRINETEPSLALIQSLLDVEHLDVLPGVDDDGNIVQFCYMNAQLKNLLLHNLTSFANPFRPSLIRVSIADKALLPDSKYPTLGIDSTLPQHRAGSPAEHFEPQQCNYPVPYFFYGTLADSEVLARVLGLDQPDSIQYESAEVYGGVLTTWANKYYGLVDAEQTAKVEGKAFWVQTREQEEALRIYETAKYKVIRCKIHLQSGSRLCMGLTFRLL